jgi:hypothetical protein
VPDLLYPEVPPDEVHDIMARHPGGFIDNQYTIHAK